MTKYIARPIANNYIRNGGFDNGTMTLWEPPTGYLTYNIISDSNYASGYCLNGVNASSPVVIIHGDYIAVKEGEHIDLSLQVNDPVVITHLATLECYNGAYKLMPSLAETANSAGSGYQTLTYNFRIPKNVAYIKLKLINSVPLGTNFSIGDISLRIQDSKDAIQKTTYIREYSTAISTPITAGSNQELTLAPTDPELVYQIIAFHFQCNYKAGMTTGTHGLEFRYGDSNLFVSKAIFPYNSRCDFYNSIVQGTPTVMEPVTQNDWYNALKNLLITNEIPLVIRYRNDTNIATDSTRTYKIMYKVDIMDNMDIY